MPSLGLGLCCRPSARGEPLRRSVLWYLMMGGRHLDGAETYRNHREVGQAIHQAIEKGVPRSEIFFTTKIPGSLFGSQTTKDWFEHALQTTGLSYVDLVLLHAAGPEPHMKQTLKCGSMPYMRACREETWVTLSNLRDEGKIRHLGVSNFGPRQITELMELKRAPVTVNQLEYHPWATALHHKTVEFCHLHGIVVTTDELFADGKRSKQGQGSRQVLIDTSIKPIAERHNKTVSQVLLRWALQKNVSAVPGTDKPEQMREHLNIWDFQLDPAEMNSLDYHSLGHAHVKKQHVPDKIM